MGMRGPFSSSSVDYSVPNPTNPDPMNFKVIKWKSVGKNLVIKLHYPDCTNFEGMKVCLFQNTDILWFQGKTECDPHFYNSTSSPFARFKPTKEGWETAIKVANILQ